MNLGGAALLPSPTPTSLNSKTTTNSKSMITLLILSFGILCLVLFYFSVMSAHIDVSKKLKSKLKLPSSNSNNINAAAAVFVASPLPTESYERTTKKLVAAPITTEEETVEIPTTTEQKLKPTWSITNAVDGVVSCTDLLPDDHPAASKKDVSLFDYGKTQSKLFTTFHVCQIKNAYILGSFGPSGETHAEFVAIFPPAPPPNWQTKDPAAPNYFVPFHAMRYRFPITAFNTPYVLGVEEQDDKVGDRELVFAYQGKDIENVLRDIEDSEKYTRKKRLPANSRFNLGIDYHDRHVPNSNNGVKTKLRNPDGTLKVKNRIPGVTLVVSPHYCCRHPVHFMESLGAASLALDKWLLKATSSSSSSVFSDEKTTTGPRLHQKCKRGQEDFKHCFSDLGHVLVFSGQGISETSFNYHVLRSVIFGAYERAFGNGASSLKIPVTSIPGNNFQYEKLIFTGARYDIWPDQENALRFVSDFRKYLGHLVSSSVNNNNKTALSTQQQQQQQQHREESSQNTTSSNAKRKTRRIVYLSRASGRKISDQDDFVNFIKKILAVLFVEDENGKPKQDRNGQEDDDEQQQQVEFVSIQALTHSVQSLYEIIGDASIIISIHGADLANLLFMNVRNAYNKPPAIIEINPVFFFEPRFYEMTKRLGFSYFSFNCGNPYCAFGGNRLLFRAHMPLDIAYDFHDNQHLNWKEEVSVPDESRPGKNKYVVKRIVNTNWPSSGYVGEVCGANCLTFVNDSPLKWKFYSVFRGSDVAMMTIRQTREDFAKILFDAMTSVGFLSEKDADRKAKLLTRLGQLY